MKDAAQGGRTVLFVSHHMLAIQKLCTKGLVSEQGQIKASGAIGEVIDDYVSTSASDVFYNAASTNGPRFISARILTPTPRTDTVLAVEVECGVARRH